MSEESGDVSDTGEVRDARVGLKLGQIGHRWDESETFNDQFRYILARRQFGVNFGISMWRVDLVYKELPACSCVNQRR